VAVLDDDSVATLWRWDGTQFVNFKYTLDTAIAAKQVPLLDIVYEQQSHRALIIWGRSSSATCKYRIWDGSTLSALGSLPSFGADAYVVRAAADPTSNYIFVGAVDKNSDLGVAVWDGSSWIDSRVLDTDVTQNKCAVFDVAWDNSGQSALVAWGSKSGSSNIVSYLTWTKGTSLASRSLQLGPDCTQEVDLVRLLPIRGGSRIALLAENKDKHLRYSLWTGNSFNGNPAILLESSVPYVDQAGPFDIAETMN
jgi:hypothetical protein